MSHGPECRRSRTNPPAGLECECVTCHCGDDHSPGGFLGTCRRCGRKRFEDLVLPDDAPGESRLAS